jgi:hypothetical protein
MLWRLEQVPLPRAAEQAPFRRSLERNVFEGFCGFSVLGQAIFRDFSAGLSPRAIARKLNQKGIAGPSGKPWRDTTIRGHFGRGTGILNNELYIGRLIWNRLTYLKDPKTGRRRSRHNPPQKWTVQDVPALRVIDEDLWQAVKARQGSIRASDGVAKARATRFWERRRSRHLLSGLVQGMWQPLRRRRARLPRLLCCSGQRHLFQSPEHPPWCTGGANP